MIKKLLVAAAPVIAILVSAPASAQPVNDLFELGRALGVVPYGCGYGTDISNAACVARTVNRHVAQIDRKQRENAQRETARLVSMNNASAALAKACSAGDEWSCQRANQLLSHASDRRVEVAKALNEACRAGDYASCRRLRN